jgi:hypothetical protein
VNKSQFQLLNALQKQIASPTFTGTVSTGFVWLDLEMLCLHTSDANKPVSGNSNRFRFKSN